MKLKSFKIIPILPFQKQAKKLLKKFPSLKNELLSLLEQLKIEPIQGTALGNNFYKIRLAIASKNKGKSGGARLITCVYLTDKEVYLLSIYVKSDRSTLSDKEIKELLTFVDR